MASVDLKGSAGPPVETLAAFEELLIDEVSPEGGVIPVQPPEHEVDLELGVDLARLELRRQEVEHHSALCLVGRNRRDPPVAHEVAEDGGLFGGGSELLGRNLGFAL